MSKTIGLLGNIVIEGTIEAKTGLHIGASTDTVEIGGIDSPVIKHPITEEPYIPGSSLKGKMRSFMEKITAATTSTFSYNRNSGTRNNEISQHVCDDIEYSYKKDDNNGAKNCPVCRVYGSTGMNGGNNHPARIVVRDCKLINKDDMKIDNLLTYEAKMENAIDRMTAAAHPRTFERVPSGAEFGFEIIYKVQGTVQENNGVYQLSSAELENVRKDIKNIFEVLNLIEKDGIGGNISRGYGHVSFTLVHDNCKYYKVGGSSTPLLPPQKDNGDEPITSLEELRQHNFSNLERLINGNSSS